MAKYKQPIITILKLTLARKGLGDRIYLGLTNGLGEAGRTLSKLIESSSPFQLKLSTSLRTSQCLITN